MNPRSHRKAEHVLLGAHRCGRELPRAGVGERPEDQKENCQQRLPSRGDTEDRREVWPGEGLDTPHPGLTGAQAPCT